MDSYFRPLFDNGNIKTFKTAQNIIMTLMIIVWKKLY